MLIKIAIIVLLIALLFGCSDGGRATRYEQSDNEKVIISTLPGTEDIYRSKYMSAGMTYEVVYMKSIVGGTGIALQMQVINITLDSLSVNHFK
jgi:PBP1b-binding outer membrane lipoprotein LpoB